MSRNKTIAFSVFILIAVCLTSCDYVQETSATILKNILQPQPEQSASPSAGLELTLDVAQNGPPVNDLIFGNNIEWVDGGDSIWDAKTNDFSRERLQVVLETKPTSMRFPGGVHADTYHWKLGVGPISSRPMGQDYYRAEKIPSTFGTDEFLKLCKKLNARPVITLNTVSGTPQEAVEWVKYVNEAIRANNYAKVLFWEVGNEPYLENKFGRLTSQEYAKQYKEYATAIRKADPQAPLGALFVGQDLEKQYRDKNGIGWNEAVLKEAGDLINYGSIHNSYYPSFIWNPLSSTEDVFKQTFSSIEKIRADFVWLKQMIGNRPIKFAVTEFNSFFGINTKFDSYVASLGGSLYVANTIQEFLNTPVIGAAQYWSILDNWYFGVFYAGKTKRPNFYVYKLYTQAQGKTMIPVESTPSKDLKVMAVKNSKEVLIYIINNNVKQPARLKVNVKNFEVTSDIVIERIAADSILANNENGQEQVNIKSESISMANSPDIDIPKHSLTLIKLKGDFK